MTKRIKITPKLRKERLAKLAEHGVRLSQFKRSSAAKQAVLGDFLEFKHAKKRLLAVIASARELQSGKTATASSASSSSASASKGKELEKNAVSSNVDMSSGGEQELKLKSLSPHSLAHTLLINLWPEIVQFSTLKSARNLSAAFPNWIPVNEMEWEASKKDFKAQVARELARAINSREDDNASKKHSLVINATTDIIDKPCYSRLWYRVASHSKNFADASVIATQILDHEDSLSENQYAESCECRRASLKAALEENGCELRSDSTFCSAFIDGETFVDMEEVVAVMMLTSALLDVGRQAWSEYRHQYENELEEKVFENVTAKDWIDAVNEIIGSENFITEEDMEEDSDDDDHYGQGGTGMRNHLYYHHDDEDDGDSDLDLEDYC